MSPPVTTFLVPAALASLLLWGTAVAAPTVTNVRASQRPASKLVDIHYDLSTPDGPSTVLMDVSADGGQNYNLTPVTAAGDIGAGIATGSDRHVVWNAEVDRPGVLSSAMRFRITADGGIPADDELDPSTLEFITRAVAAGDYVFPSARRSLDNFVRECKRLGFWSRMVFVPCREGYGAMHPMGGSPRRTDGKFVRQGTTSLTTDGVAFTPGAGYANRVQTPAGWTQEDEPVFIGVLGHTGTGNHINPGYSFLRRGPEPTSNLLGTYNRSSVEYPFVSGFKTPGAGSGEYFLDNMQCTSVKRPNFAGAQYDGSHVLKCVHNHLFSSLYHSTGTTGRPDSGPVCFFQPADENQTHVIQGCLLIHGDVAGLPMRDFWALASSTLLSDRPAPFTYLCLGGQSNAYSEITTQLAVRDWREAEAPLFIFSNFRYGGQFISYWVGPDPNAPQRMAGYESSKNVWMASRPLVADAYWDPVYFWIHGEADTESDSGSRDYAKQLDNLARFLREDLRPDLIFAIGQIDYAVQYRTTPHIGNFTLSGCEGAAAGANGLFSIAPLQELSDSFTPYTWTRGSYQCSKDGGAEANRWRFHANGVTWFQAVEDEPHPVLVKTWTALNGASGSPAVGISRTGIIERVRKIQREFVKRNPRSFSVDTRGCERPMDAGGTDGVHMTVTGYTLLADRFSQAHRAWREAATGSAESSIIVVDTRQAFAVWAGLSGLQGVNAEPEADVHHDGVSNLLKYAFNMNAAAADCHHLEPDGDSGLPAGEVVMGEDGLYKLQLRVIRRKNDPDLAYQAEFSDSLSSWPPGTAAVPVEVTSLGTQWERVIYRDTVPAAVSRRFGRVRVIYRQP